MKTIKLFPVLILLISLMACQTSECANGIQDGNETGVDCGGDCPDCSNVAPEEDCATLTYRVTLSNPVPADSIILITFMSQAYGNVESIYMSSGESVWTYTRPYIPSSASQDVYEIQVGKLHGHYTFSGSTPVFDHGSYKTDLTVELIKDGNVVSSQQVIESSWIPSYNGGNLSYYSLPTNQIGFLFSCQ
jgi:hypothetical protein